MADAAAGEARGLRDRLRRAVQRARLRERGGEGDRHGAHVEGEGRRGARLRRAGEVRGAGGSAVLQADGGGDAAGGSDEGEGEAGVEGEGDFFGVGERDDGGRSLCSGTRRVD